jgi:hypothetical protein
MFTTAPRFCAYHFHYHRSCKQGTRLPFNLYQLRFQIWELHAYCLEQPEFKFMIISGPRIIIRLYELCSCIGIGTVKLGIVITISVVWVRERTILTERPPLVGEISVNVCGQWVPRGHRDGSLWPHFWLSRPEQLLFLSSSSSIVLTRLTGPRSRPSTSQKIW